MIKTHVFALILALFTAGLVLVVVPANVADAHTKHTTCRVVDHNNGCRMTGHADSMTVNQEDGSASSKSAGVIRVADDYIGLTERANRRQLMDLFDFAFQHRIDPAKTRWCAAFVNGVLAKSGKKVTGSATAASFLKWGKRTSTPSMGDVVVLGLRGSGASHVGFYMGTTKINGQRFVKVLGGNQRNSVKVAYYPAGKVIQYRKAS